MTLAGFVPEGPPLSLARFHALTPYLAAPQQLTAQVPDWQAGSLPNPFDHPRYAVASPSTRPAAARVTAILISQDRRLAIIDEQILSVSDPVPGAGRIEAIEPERVIISRNGRREILRLLPEARIR